MCSESVHIYIPTASSTPPPPSSHSRTKVLSKTAQCNKGATEQKTMMKKCERLLLLGRSFFFFFAARCVPYKIPKLYSQDFKIVIRIPARFNVEYVGSLRVKSGTYLNVHFIIWLAVCEHKHGLAACQ